MMIQELQHPEEMLSMQKINQHSQVYYSMIDSSQRMKWNQCMWVNKGIETTSTETQKDTPRS